MKHAPNGREESKTARDWDPRTHQQTARDWDPRTHETRASPTAGKYKEFTKQPSVTAETKQREEWVQKFQKLFHRVRMWMRPEGPKKTSTQRRKVFPGDATRTGWCVSRASDVLEMIQQKSVYRSNSGMLTGGLTIFSRSRCIASETRRTRDIQQKTSTGRV